MRSINLAWQTYSFGTGASRAYSALQRGDRWSAAEQFAQSAMQMPGLYNSVRQTAQLINAARGGRDTLASYLNNCFGAGTPICWEFGSKPIENFVPGERVWARDENDAHAPLQLKEIEECFVATAALWHLHIGGEVIRTTDEHPFWVVGRGWASAQDLEAGDRLIGRDGSETLVEEAYETGQVETVYNFRVAEHHTYFVGDEAWGFDVWAHNRCSWRDIENRAQATATGRGEIVMNVQRPGGTGFDFASVRNIEGRLQLVFNEVKRYRNNISPSRFTAFGLGRGGPPVMQRNVDRVRTAIDTDTRLTRAEKDLLIDQLDNDTAMIRIIARRGLVSENTRDYIQSRTGLITQIGF